jgi:superfamily II DNA or RNA helicase
MEAGGYSHPWVDLAPRFQWRPSQRHLLELAGHVCDRRWHLCAPPGAGKTLIGLELARRVATPTLVLAPTIAVRDQWRATTAMFGADPAHFSTDDPLVAAPLVAATYQLLGNPGEAAAELRAAGRRLWVAEVAQDTDFDIAEQRVTVTEQRDPRRARRELRRHVRALRRSLSSPDDIGVSRSMLLGERTVALIERLAAARIGCLILDECHHLLDWWALVVSALVERLRLDREVALIGLTATLPRS